MEIFREEGFVSPKKNQNVAYLEGERGQGKEGKEGKEKVKSDSGIGIIWGKFWGDVDKFYFSVI